MHNGLMSSLLSYPIKYLNEYFLPYDSLLETIILLMSMSPVLKIIFCFNKNYSYLVFYNWKVYSFHSFFYGAEFFVK